MARCPCGVLASLKRPCKRCGRSLHLAHGHAPDDHFDEVEHEWFYTGGTHVPGGQTAVRAGRRGEPCPHAHAHPYTPTPGGHEHGPDGEIIYLDTTG